MLKQFIPNDFCLKCDICCRFGQKNSVYAPKFLSGECRSEKFFAPTLKRHGNNFICQFFSPGTNACTIYAQRPLDCQLYPFMVTYDKNYENIILVLDTKCPYVQKMGVPDKFDVETRLIASLPHNFIMPYQPDTIKIAAIKNLNGFKTLSLEHKPLFDKYLKNETMSTRSFTNIYIWSDLFNILWKIVNGNLCIFYEYKNEFNMLLPPIPSPSLRGAPPKAGRRSNLPGFIGDCLPWPEISAGQGFGPEISGPRNDKRVAGRIENIAEHEIDTLKACGLKVRKNTDEYIYLAKDLAELKGNKYAKQRAAANQFIKKYKPEIACPGQESWQARASPRQKDGGARNGVCVYRPFEIDDIDACLVLYAGWADERKKKCKDSVYAQLLDESFSSHRRAMLDYEALGLIGRVIEVNSKMRAYTFGFKMNENTYCITLEVADLSVNGLAQFIYKRFAQELLEIGAVYINAMDDSGLENLKKTKLAWHPYKILTNYIGTA